MVLIRTMTNCLMKIMGMQFSHRILANVMMKGIGNASLSLKIFGQVMFLTLILIY